MTAMLDAALDYAGRMRWPVLPLRSGSKEPLTPHGFKDASTDEEQIQRWWSRWPAANVGSPLTDDLIVVDEDEPGALRAVVANLGPLPSTAFSRTQGGGRHLFYRLTGDRRLRHGFQLVEGTGDHDGVELRCGGKGYVLLPPSRTPTGSYEWIVEPFDDSIADAPEWLFDVAVERPGRDPAEWNDLAGKVVPEGARNNTLASVAGLLYRRLPAELAYDLGLLWALHRTSPPMDEREARRTLESIAWRELARRKREAS